MRYEGKGPPPPPKITEIKSPVVPPVGKAKKRVVRADVIEQDDIPVEITMVTVLRRDKVIKIGRCTVLIGGNPMPAVAAYLSNGKRRVCSEDGIKQWLVLNARLNTKTVVSLLKEGLEAWDKENGKSNE